MDIQIKKLSKEEAAALREEYRRSQDRRQARLDMAEENAEAVYGAAFTRIAERIKAEEISDGADEDYRPCGARVHRLVQQEMNQQ